jgi:hypothetical protein
MKMLPQFNLDLPDHWSDQTAYYFVGPEVNGVPHMLTVTLDRQLQDKDLETFARRRIDLQVEATGGLEVLKDEPTTLPSGKEVHEFVGRWIPSDDHIVFKKTVYLIVEGIGYTFAADFSKHSLKTVGVEMMQMAYAGQSVEFEVRTALVGEGAPVKIKGKSAEGKKLGKVSGEVRGNTFVGRFDIPEDVESGDEVYFEVKLPKNSLDGESGRIPVRPLIELANLKWSAEEARRGDIVTLSAEVSRATPQTEATLTIYEYDQDGAHDRIVELPTKVIGDKIELEWAYEYHEDTGDIPTDEELKKHGREYNPPEYYFTVKFDKTEFGLDLESGLLKFKDWVEIFLSDANGDPIGDQDYVLKMPDGSERKGKVDSKGRAIEENVPPGEVSVRFKEYDYVTSSDSSE